MNIQIFALVGGNSSSTRPAYKSEYKVTLVNSKIELTSLIHEKILKCMNVMCVECLSDCHLYHIHKCSYYVVIFANYPKL